MSSLSSQATASATPVIDFSGVKAADIIVTRNEAAQSKVIRAGTCSTYSHAILVLDSTMCIEATAAGVSKLTLKQALSHSTYGSLYRHKSIDANYAAWVCYYAEQHKGKPYDYGGAIRSGVSTGCKPIRNTLGGVVIQLVDDISKKGNHEDSFFCSELIVNAFDKACLPIINGGAYTATPGAIAKSHYLNFIKDVVTV